MSSGIFVINNNLITWRNNGGALNTPEPAYTANSLNYTKSFIATSDAAGTPVSVADATTPYGGNVGFKIRNVGASPVYFPVGASFTPAMTGQFASPNRMMISNQSGTPQIYCSHKLW